MIVLAAITVDPGISCQCYNDWTPPDIVSDGRGDDFYILLQQTHFNFKTIWPAVTKNFEQRMVQIINLLQYKIAISNKCCTEILRD